MIKVRILKSAAEHATAAWPTQQEADAWLAEGIVNNWWGKPERWVRAGDEDVSQALETREVEGELGETITEYHLPAEYEIEVEDVSAKVAMEKAISDGLKAQDVGAKIIAKVRAVNGSKALTSDQIISMMSDPTLAAIRELLWTGSLQTAKGLIQGLDETYFTLDEKAKIVAMIDESGL